MGGDRDEERDADGRAEVAGGVVGAAAHRRAVGRHAGHGLAAEHGVEEAGADAGRGHHDREPPGPGVLGQAEAGQLARGRRHEQHGDATRPGEGPGRPAQRQRGHDADARPTRPRAGSRRRRRRRDRAAATVGVSDARPIMLMPSVSEPSVAPRRRAGAAARGRAAAAATRGSTTASPTSATRAPRPSSTVAASTPSRAWVSAATSSGQRRRRAAPDRDVDPARRLGPRRAERGPTAPSSASGHDARDDVRLAPPGADLADGGGEQRADRDAERRRWRPTRASHAAARARGEACGQQRQAARQHRRPADALDHAAGDQRRRRRRGRAHHRAEREQPSPTS